MSTAEGLAGAGVGLEHALATRRLYTDGAAILYEFADGPVDEDAALELAGLTRWSTVKGLRRRRP